MDNKLSEMSKPVAQIYYDEHDSSVMRIGWLRSDEPKNPEPLYSQEYVSALLVSLGVLGRAIDMANESTRIWKERADDAEKRIAEMEERLATPVRLPTKYSLKLAGDKSTRAMFSGHNSAINDSADAIRAAGFKVEGDEQ